MVRYETRGHFGEFPPQNLSTCIHQKLEISWISKAAQQLEAPHAPSDAFSFAASSCGEPQPNPAMFAPPGPGPAPQGPQGPQGPGPAPGPGPMVSPGVMPVESPQQLPREGRRSEVNYRLMADLGNGFKERNRSQVFKVVDTC